MRYVVLGALLVIASGCSQQRPVSPRPEPVQPGPASHRPPPAETAPRPAPAPPPAPRIRPPVRKGPGTARHAVEVARAQRGKPYRYGGNGKPGFDCSGLTRYVFERLGIEVPRTTKAQATVGEWVAPDELRAGDLVFFGHSRDRLFHVGLVVSEPGQPLEMIHASESRGVTETEIFASRYWLRRFMFGRRVLP